MHDFPGTVWAAVDRSVTRFLTGIAVEDTHGRALTFAQFRDAAELVAAGLYERGIGAGTRVSWHLPTGVEACVLMAALARVGAVQNPLILNLREAELSSVAEQFDPEFVFTVERFRNFDHGAMVRAVFPRAQIVVSERTSADAQNTVPGGVALALELGDPATLPPPPETDAIRWIYTTSGSTAAPKCVQHTDESAWGSSNVMVERLPFRRDDVFSIAFPLSHIGGATCWFISLRVGLDLQLIDVFDPVQSPLDMAAAGASVLGSATPFFDAYLNAQQAHGTEPLFPRINFCSGGGAPVAPSLDRRMQHEIGGVGILNGYGLTEFPSAGFPPVDDPHGLRDHSSWLPGPDVHARIVGPDESDCGVNEEGELVLAGPQLFSGYLDRELTDAAMDPRGYVRTGDLATIGPHGEVTITGRIKEIVIRNGENISLPEVEAVLIGHPAVVDVAVVGLPDAHTGERCCAAVILAVGAQAPEVAALQALCIDAGLAKFKAPEQVAVVTAIPRSAMGKIQRGLLRDDILAAAR